MGKYRVLLFGLFRIFVSMAVDAQQVLPQLPDSAIMLQRKLTKAPALDSIALPALDTLSVPPFDSISISIRSEGAPHTRFRGRFRCRFSSVVFRNGERLPGYGH